MRLIVAALLLLTLSSCEVIEQPSGLIPRWTTAYKQVISENDRVRLRDWRKSFEEALAEVTKAGHGVEIAREGSLLDPDAAQAGPSIPNGTYRCRVIKLGAKDPGNLEFVAMPQSSCRVRAERQLQRLAKLSGSQRYVGLIFPGDAIRKIFLGTLVLGDEHRALQYGQDEKRDVAGYLERIGPNRWRVLMPQPHFDSKFDVMEITAEGATP
jgi:Domain of unknown function (DUF4893)